MTLQEVLKAQNLTDEQVKGILDAMKQNKIFTASEENLDVRYGKLKTDSILPFPLGIRIFCLQFGQE